MCDQCVTVNVRTITGSVGLLCPTHAIEPQDHGPGPQYLGASRLGPRAFSARVVDSLGGSFVLMSCQAFFSTTQVDSLIVLDVLGPI